VKPVVVLLAFLVLVSLVANAVCLFRFGWRRPSRARTMAIRFTTVGTSVLLAFLALELVVSHLFITSDNFSFTLHSKRWFQLYWEPENDLDYRDDEYKDLDKKKLLFVVGDSFVAGHGIKDYRDRFSNVLGVHMGEDWATLNIARNGWNTAEEFAAVITHPYKPDAIVLSYFLNDIEDAAVRHGIKRPQLIGKPPAIIRKIVDKTYLFNYLYWRHARRANSAQMIAEYGKFRDTLYADARVWATHVEELGLFVEYAQKHKVPLVVVIFPDLFNVAGTAAHCRRVHDFFVAAGFPVLNLADVFAGRSPQDIVVGTYDGHPNPAAHREVADLLFERYFAQGPPPPPPVAGTPGDLP